MATTYKDLRGDNTTQLGFNGAGLRQELTLGFLQGRAYRAYRKFTANTTLRLTATKPFMLTEQRLSCSAGAAEVIIYVGATNGGTYTALPTKFVKNGVYTPAHVSTTVIEVGGTRTGGTEREVISVNSGAGAGAVSVQNSPRLLPAGTYWLDIVVTGSTVGVYSIEYEEMVDTAPV
jgi:hypothetical protein